MDYPAQPIVLPADRVRPGPVPHRSLLTPALRQHRWADHSRSAEHDDLHAGHHPLDPDYGRVLRSDRDSSRQDGQMDSRAPDPCSTEVASDHATPPRAVGRWSSNAFR